MKKFKGVITICVLIAFCFVSVGHRFALAQEVKKELSEGEERFIKSFLEERQDKNTDVANISYTIAAVSAGLAIAIFFRALTTSLGFGTEGVITFLIFLLSIVGSLTAFVIGIFFSIEAHGIDQEIKERFPEPTPVPNNPT